MEQEQLLNDLIELVAHQNDLTAGIYTTFLAFIGIIGAVFVLILLYKFIRLFY